MARPLVNERSRRVVLVVPAAMDVATDFLTWLRWSVTSCQVLPRTMPA